jgi:hypothetical protein
MLFGICRAGFFQSVSNWPVTCRYRQIVKTGNSSNKDWRDRPQAPRRRGHKPETAVNVKHVSWRFPPAPAG